MKFFVICLKLSLAYYLVFPEIAIAQEEPSTQIEKQDDFDSFDNWGDEEWEEKSPWHGFVEYLYAQRFNHDSLFSNKKISNEVRIHLEREEQFENWKLSLKGDTWYDQVLSKAEIDIRELSASFSIFNSTDIKLGRQILTWGTGDLIFVNDLFPKNWESFFNGREDTYLKAPANAVRINSYFDSINIDFVWTPKFTPDSFIDGERYSFYSPFAQQNVGGERVVLTQEPDSKVSNGEIALRLYKNIEGTEYAFYVYRGFDKQPLGLTNNQLATFHRKNAFGASLRGNFKEGLYNIEFVYLDSREDQNGNNPFVENSQWKFLLGYETELLPKLTVNFQYYLEQLSDYQALVDSSPFPLLERNRKRTWLTNRITYRAMQDKLTWSFVTFYSPSDKDGYLRWNAQYRQNDNWSYIAGINILDGEESNTFFSQFQDSSNIYTRLRYNF